MESPCLKFLKGICNTVEINIPKLIKFDVPRYIEMAPPLRMKEVLGRIINFYTTTVWISFISRK